VNKIIKKKLLKYFRKTFNKSLIDNCNKQIDTSKGQGYATTSRKTHLCYYNGRVLCMYCVTDYNLKMPSTYKYVYQHDVFNYTDLHF